MRRGVNVIELGIILLVLLILLALSAVGFQKVHSAAARMSCQNNLKQFGIAIHNYHDANNHFPTGTLPNAELSPEQRLSFHVAIVPYIECDNLYRQFELKEAWDSGQNRRVPAAYKRYWCPSWGEVRTAPRTGYLTPTNYIGVAGVGADAATRPTDAPGVGIFGYDRKVTFKDVKDGTDSTAMLLETTRDVGPWIRGGPSTVRAVDVDESPLVGIDQSFGGKHDSSFNILLGDSAVRFTTTKVDPAVLGALATIAGGEELPANW